MGLQFSITAIGSLLLQSAVNRLGASSVAAYAAAYKVQVFVSCPFDALGTTMSNFGAQNVGARKFPRIKEGLRDGVILGLSYSVIAFVIVFFWGRELGGLFIDKSETEILDQVQQFLTACGATYGLLALIMTIRLMIQGMGYTNIAMLAGVCELISRAIVAIFLVPAIGYTAVCMASPIAWLAADLMLVPTFFACYKKLTLHYHPL